MVKVQAKVAYAMTESEIEQPDKVKRGKDGIRVIIMQATNEYGVPASSKTPTPSETKEEQMLLECWQELEKMGRSDSL